MLVFVRRDKIYAIIFALSQQEGVVKEYQEKI